MKRSASSSRGDVVNVKFDNIQRGLQQMKAEIVRGANTIEYADEQPLK